MIELGRELLETHFKQLNLKVKSILLSLLINFLVKKYFLKNIS